MKVDAHTLRDLDLLGGRDLSLSVFALVDRTRSAAGRERLRQRFRAPPRDEHELRETQDAVRFLAAHAERRVVGVDADAFAAAQRYASSTVMPIGAGTLLGAVVEARWIRLRYPELIQIARAGVPSAIAIIHWADRWASGMVEQQAPSLLRAIAREVLDVTRSLLREALETPLHEELSTSTLLLLDRRLREDQRDAFGRLNAAVADADALIAMAESTVQLGFHFPELASAGAPVFEVTGLWHPFLPNPVANDLALTSQRRMLFLTGPNMAGKSTLLKACGVALFLGQLGMGVPARAMRWSFRDRLLSSIDVDDDVRLGYSYFFSEVQRVRQIAEALASGDRCAVLCDELFRGTNVMDAQDATKLVLQGFAAWAESWFVVSSHLVELVDQISGVPGLAFACLEGELRGDELRFDHRLRDGHSAQRLGLVLLERAGVPRLLVPRPHVAS